MVGAEGGHEDGQGSCVGVSRLSSKTWRKSSAEHGMITPSRARSQSAPADAENENEAQRKGGAVVSKAFPLVKSHGVLREEREEEGGGGGGDGRDSLLEEEGEEGGGEEDGEVGAGSLGLTVHAEAAGLGLTMTSKDMLSSALRRAPLIEENELRLGKVLGSGGE